MRAHLLGYQAVIGVHTDRDHIHAHIVFNSVNQLTGEKYHSSAGSYYQQIRGISDRLCREHGLSVLLSGEPAKAISYVEWLRQSKGQPTFRSLLEADLRTAIQDANDLGHFFLLMEHMGYEIHHGGRLGFRLRGQERFQYPGRRDPLFTEDGIRAAIQGNLAEIEAGHRPAVIQRPRYRPYRKHPKYTGFLALYVHYLYLLGKIGQRQYPPRMTHHLRQEVVPTYFVRKPVAWNDLLFRRVENHMGLYNLYTSYAVHAAEEIIGRSGIWHVFLDRCGEDFLAASFHDEAVSREQLFLNSWQSALYRGLEEHIDFVTQWLRL